MMQQSACRRSSAEHMHAAADFMPQQQSAYRRSSAERVHVVAQHSSSSAERVHDAAECMRAREGAACRRERRRKEEKKVGSVCIMSKEGYRACF